MVRTSKCGKREDTNLALKKDDIIASKGSGLIILLHGGPGTGKTLTAGEFRVHSNWCCTNMNVERYVVFLLVCSGYCCINIFFKIC
jgi:chloramphenicol 3-O-phosphotransferase